MHTDFTRYVVVNPIYVATSAKTLLRQCHAYRPRAVPFGPDMHQIVCRLGFAPDPSGGAYSAPPGPLAGLRGPTTKGGEGTEGEGRGGEGRRDPRF